MKSYFLVNLGLEPIALKELEELTNQKGKIIGQGVIEAELNKEKLAIFYQYSQTIKAILLALAEGSNPAAFVFSKDWLAFFHSNHTFKIETGGISDKDQRVNLCRQLSFQLILTAKQEANLNLEVDLKKPDCHFLLSFIERHYFFGMCLGKDLDKREYRLFPHKASFRGDIASFFVRISGEDRPRKLLVGPVRDGTLLIEAAFFCLNRPVRPLKKLFWCGEEPFSSSEKKTGDYTLAGFDENQNNLRAAKKNLQLAGLSSLVSLNQLSLEELGSTFSKNSFDLFILQATKKDEEKINEVYSQVSSILREKGILMVIGREGWELSISSRFQLILSGIIKKGNSGLRYWKLELR